MKSKFVLFSLLCSLPVSSLYAAPVTGWLHWRGPHQNGTSDETGLPDNIEIGGKNHLWTFEMAGRGEAVIAGDRVYAFGYAGEGPDLREYLTCLEAGTGKVIWQHGFNDFLSDIVYERYAIGAPTVDSETGNIYLMTTAGEMVCFNPAGDILWRYSMMERFGLLTFPNGRRGAAVIEGELVIHHCITSYWGVDGPARDRFFAFRKKTGELVWSSTPGTPPKDSSFSSPVIASVNDKRVLYCGTGCGNLVAINVLTGDPLWRYHFSHGGVNSSVLLHSNNKLIAIHGKENIDTTEVGRMAAIKIGAEPVTGQKGPVVLDKSAELWRQSLVMFTSSPVLVGDRIYQVSHTGELECLDANSGSILWHHKLENGQLHASPLYADGKLYVPMVSGNFYILKLKDGGVEQLDMVRVDGGLLGAPTVWNGKIYLHSKKKLYCFGKAGGSLKGEAWASHLSKGRTNGVATRLQIIPSDVLLDPNEEASFEVRALDANGRVVGENIAASFEKFTTPTARVKTEIDATFNGKTIIASGSTKASAGAFRANAYSLVGLGKGRVLSGERFTEDFEGFKITEKYPEGHVHGGVEFAYPPLPWIGARFKWDIQNRNGNNVLVKTLDRVLFQRATTFFGDPEMSEYTIEADVMTDGNRRMKSNVGLINQRYVIELIGNWQRLEVSSNHDRIKVSVPFKWSTKTWHRLKSRVDLANDGSGVVRAKAWKRDEPEPDDWTIEVPHKVAHDKGAPGIRGFSPQSRYSVYVDNISVYSNPKGSN
ncbi:MAG: Outer membrane protein assembly factor BamB [Verrucomicrobia subdivision 3 bacterium]|nr:Outer membrane protein assembly factor BamB [Limisphaerales bacterium]MCS1413629.1 Outer membrane protein assembly factor BamB [Limisphaerales bacterium]